MTSTDARADAGTGGGEERPSGRWWRRAPGRGGEGAFRSLGEPAYRLWFTSSVVSNAGTWMQRVAQDWLVLTSLTHDSATAVGITTGLQFGPVLFIGPLAGTLADRLDRRKILIVTQCAMAALAAVLGLLVITGHVQLWHVYVLAGVQGAVSALDNPARQTYVGSLVEPELLPNAVSLNAVSFHTGRLIGPAVAGVMIHLWGTGVVFLLNTATFAGVLIALMRLGRLENAHGMETAGHGSQGGRVRGGLGAGLAYLRTRADLMVTLVAVGLVATFTLNFQLTTAVMARLAYHQGPGQYGLLGSVLAVGGVSGSIMAARRTQVTVRILQVSALGLGLSAGLASLMPSYWTFAVMLVPVGFAALSFMTGANTLMQVSTAPQLRGRVMAIYSMVFMGGSPLGSPLIGWIGDTFGPRWTIGVGSIFALITAGLLWRFGRLHPRPIEASQPDSS